MTTILTFSENALLARQLVANAIGLGGSVSAIAITTDGAEDLTSCAVESVYLLDGQSSRPEDYAKGLAELAKTKGADYVLIGDTLSGRELGAKTAALLDAPLVSGASEIKQTWDSVSTCRALYGGAVVKYETVAPLAIITVMTEGRQEPGNGGRRASIIQAVPTETDGRVKIVAHEPIPHEGASLDSATKVVGVGLGFNSKEDLALADDLATVLDAAVGCTRPVAEDKNWLPAERYIGISGANIQPELYLAIGISGQVQHIAGIRGAKIVAAINKNEDAPIFKSADYGIVGDLYEVIPQLIAALKK